MKIFRLLPLIMLIFVLVLAACGGGDVATDTTTEENVSQVEDSEQETAVSLADEVRVEEGGYAFQPPVGYEVSVDSLFAEMSVADQPDTIINLFGTPLMDGMGLDVMYDSFITEFEGDDTVTLGERESINPNGLTGFSVTLKGDEDGTTIKGKIIAVGNDTQGVFILSGAEESQWDDTVNEQVDAVVNSISLFEMAMLDLGLDDNEVDPAETTEDTDTEEAADEEVAESEEIEEAETEEDSAEAEASDVDTAAEYDTVFPMPESVENFMGEGGETPVNFQTSLSLEDAVVFYREELTAQELVERDLLTVEEDGVFSIVFDGHENGMAIVIQGVDLGESSNINIRFENT